MSGERWQQDAGTDLLLPGLPAALLPLSERRTTAPVLLLHHPAPGAERAPLLSPVRAGRAAQVTGALIGSWKRAMREERRGEERRGEEERRGGEERRGDLPECVLLLIRRRKNRKVLQRAPPP